MNLEKHASFEFPCRQLALDVDHRKFDHVGGGALNRSVDGVALGGAPHGIVRGADVAQIAPTAGYGFDIPMLPHKGDRVIHVSSDAWKLFEILLDDLGAFFAWDAETL